MNEIVYSAISVEDDSMNKWVIWIFKLGGIEGLLGK
jgi:hypothetical protein